MEGGRHPITLVVRDDLERTRLTVFFRLILAIPHFIWLTLWTIAAVFAAIANWFATLFEGTPPQALHGFLTRYLRYTTHFYSYLYLAANPWPDFDGRRGEYPVDLEVGGPERQNRWTVGFRLILALPAVLLASALASSVDFSSYGGGSRNGWETAATWGGGVAAIAAFGAWFLIMARGRMKPGLRDLIAYCIGYSAQAWGYVLLLTGRYPSADPAKVGNFQPLPDHDVNLELEDDLRRSRLTVFFRLLLAIPHFIWLTLWGIAVFFSLIANWFVTLFSGTPAPALHRFNSRYLRYQAHVYSFFLLVANPFPRFTGERRSYPVDLELPEPRRQNRWVTGFRIFLWLPVGVLSSALGNIAFLAAFFMWWYAMFTGRVPDGLRNLSAFVIRYYAQADAYLYLITDRYPYSGPFATRAQAGEPVVTDPTAPAAPEPEPSPA
ncbi:MAG: DUF4389 domain-containing protein [Thermoleophilaceae bacterium]